MLLTGFSFADFGDASALNVLGDAGTPGDGRLRLTEAVGGQEGAAWYVAGQQFVAVDWETTFQFQLHGGSDGPGGTDGSDGFAFVIQNANSSWVGGGGGHLGYGGLANSLAVEFDTYLNNGVSDPFNDPSSSHISVHTNGAGDNSANEAFSLGAYNTSQSGFILDNAQVHTAKIRYEAGSLQVFLDNMNSPVLSVAVNLPSTLNLNGGQAWLGFTASTGGGYQNHDILNWGFETLSEPTTLISISDANATEGDASYRFTDNFVAPDAYGLAAARDLLIGPDGNVYVASHDTDSVKVFEAGTGRFLRDLATAGGELDGPWGLVFGPDGFLYVGGRYSRNVVRFDIADGTYSEFVATASGGLGSARGLAFGADGNLYVSSRVEGEPTTTDTVKRYDGMSGAYLGDFVTAGSGGLDNANAVAFGPDGNLYVASTRGRQILRYDGQTGAFMDAFVTVPSAEMGNPNDFLFHADGLLYVTENGGASVYRYSATTGAFVDTFVSAPSTQGFNGSGLAFAQSGEFYLSLGTGTLRPGSLVRRFAPASTAAFTVSLSAATTETVTVNYTVNSGTAQAGSDFVAASGTLTFAPGQTSQTIFVQTIDNAVYENSETFTVTLSNASAGATIADGTGVGTIADDDPVPTKFYVVDAGSDRTYEYTEGGQSVENYSLNTGNINARGAASDATGERVWVIDNNDFVYIYDAAGTLLGSWKANGLNTPEGIASNGTDIWIVDRGADKVFRFAGAASRTSGSQAAASSFSLDKQNKDAKGIETDGTYFWVVNNASTDKVFKYTLSGSLLGSWTLQGGVTNPTGITLDPTNPSDIWIVDASADKVFQYTATANRTSGSQSASASFNLAPGNTNPQGIADPPPESEMTKTSELQLLGSRITTAASSQNIESSVQKLISTVFSDWQASSDPVQEPGWSQHQTQGVGRPIRPANLAFGNLPKPQAFELAPASADESPLEEADLDWQTAILFSEKLLGDVWEL